MTQPIMDYQASFDQQLAGCAEAESRFHLRATCLPAFRP